MFTLFLTQHVIVTWLLVSLALLLVELATPGIFFFVSFAFGSLFGALVASLGYPLPVQCATVLVISIIQFTAMRRRLRSFNNKSSLATNVHALLGKRGVVVRDITQHQPGLVKLGGEEWSATCSEGKKIAKGKSIQVVRLQGNRVIVKLSE